MEEREILEAIEVIFSKESREDSLQYRYADTQIITSLEKPLETRICHESDRFRFVSGSVDLMRGLLKECHTESQRALFFGVPRETFDASSPYHPWAPLASAMGYGEKAKREFMKTVAVKEVMANEVITLSPEASIEEDGKEGFVSITSGCIHPEGQCVTVAVWCSFDDEAKCLQNVIPQDDLHLPIALPIRQDNF